jgi:hypothetical protein
MRWGKKLDEKAIVDLSAFLGWHSAWWAQSFLVDRLEGGDEVRVGLESDIPALSRIMFLPAPEVESAIAEFKKSQTAFLDKSIDATQLAFQRTAIFDKLAGLQPVDSTGLMARVKRSMIVPIALLTWDLFAKTLESVQEHPFRDQALT